MFDTNEILKIIMIVGIGLAILLMLAFRTASRQADSQAKHRGRTSVKKAVDKARHGSN